MSGAPRPAVVLDVASERASRRELSELVPDHALGDEHRDMLAAVVHGNGVPEHVRDDRRATRPGFDHALAALVVLRVHLLEQVVIDERTLLQTPWHGYISSSRERSSAARSPPRRRAPTMLTRTPTSPLLVRTTTADDQLVAGLVVAGAAFRLAVRVDRVPATRCLALATAVRVVDRVHRHAADGRPLALPTHPAGLAPVDVALLGVAHLADGGAAAHVDVADLAGRHPQLGERTLLGHQLHAGTGRPGDLGATARPQLDRVHRGADRDVAQRQGVARLDVGARPVLHLVALVEVARGQDVALLAVGVVQQRDPSGPVRVVLDVRDLGRHAVLVVA